jgi:hypothetical protein
MMRTAGTAAFLLLVACGAAFAQISFLPDVHEGRTGPTWAKEIGAGFVGEVAATAVVTVTVFGVGSASGAFMDPDGSAAYTYAGIWLLSMVAVVPAGCMLGVKLADNQDYESGNLAASYGGGLVGTLGAFALAYYGNQIIWSRDALAPGIALYTVAALLPAVGAAAGYNMTPSEQFGFGRDQRFLPPSASLTLASRSDGARMPGISARLLTLRL